MAEHRRQLLNVVDPLPPEAWQRTARVTDLPGKIVDHTLRFFGSWLADYERGHLEQIRGIVTR